MLIGSDFQPVRAIKARRCGECDRRIEAGAVCYESRRYGRVQKRVCSKACQASFDDRYWQDKADERELCPEVSTK